MAYFGPNSPKCFGPWALLTDKAQHCGLSQKGMALVGAEGVVRIAGELRRSTSA